MRGWGLKESGGPCVELDLPEPEVAPGCVLVRVHCCGICGTDLHVMDEDWGPVPHPCVCGHEVVGTVAQAGEGTTLAVGARVGVGYQCGSCGTCDHCAGGNEQFCRRLSATILEGRCGGFAERLSVPEAFAFTIPDGIEDEHASVLMCAGLTVWPPLQRHLVNDKVHKPRQRYAVVGLGGVGHMAVLFGKALGCHVTVFSRGGAKRSSALELGADAYVDTDDESAMRSAFESADLVFSTTSAADPRTFLKVVAPGGTLCYVSLPMKEPFTAMGMLLRNKTIGGSLVGSNSDMRAMLAFADEHKIKPHAEVFEVSKINEAIERVRTNQARFRVVVRHKQEAPKL